MRKSLLPLVIFFGCCAFFFGCTKNTPYVTAISPSLTATIDGYQFVASTTVPSTLDSQASDTTTSLIITGYGSDLRWPNDRIVLEVASYKGKAGTFSIVQGQASAHYYHNGMVSPASGGIVSITKVTSNSIVGYFSFVTTDTAYVLPNFATVVITPINIKDGSFTVGLP
jgi:hypothetical protein